MTGHSRKKTGKESTKSVEHAMGALLQAAEAIESIAPGERGDEDTQSGPQRSKCPRPRPPMAEAESESIRRVHRCLAPALALVPHGQRFGPARPLQFEFGL